MRVLEVDPETLGCPTSSLYFLWPSARDDEGLIPGERLTVSRDHRIQKERSHGSLGAGRNEQRFILEFILE